MSRIGKAAIKLPPEVKVKIEEGKVLVSGPKGNLELFLAPKMRVKQSDEELLVECGDKSQKGRSLHGATRALVANMVKGVSEGFRKELELSGVGYRAQLEAGDLNLAIGFSHPVKFKPPEGITMAVKENKIIIEGADKQLVGEVASKIRILRPPEPYKGKGIRYVGEKIRRKAGKVAKTVGGVK